ncbi:MAG: lysylphosphatidylglycerol synthase transmembrane domain-containing protein, partial [Bacteroidota bacterium]
DATIAEEFIISDSGAYIQKTSVAMLGEFEWTSIAIFGLLGALLMLVIRDAMYMYRIRHLTNKQLSWRSAFDVILLWEFASALTPSVVGGSGIAIFIMNREGISLGKGTATVMVTALMDELFYILSVPIFFLIVGSAYLFPNSEVFQIFGINSIKGVFVIAYLFFVALTITMILALFIFPQGAKKLMMTLFSIRVLKRWQPGVIKWGDDLIISSKEIRGESVSYWLKGFGATVLSWSARFLTLNFILIALIGSFDHFQVFGRQLVMWVIMLISPTPGSSGVAELAFNEFFAYLMPAAFLAIAAITWRLLTYMPYLIAGIVVLPGWMRRTSNANRTSA